MKETFHHKLQHLKKKAGIPIEQNIPGIEIASKNNGRHRRFTKRNKYRRRRKKLASRRIPDLVHNYSEDITFVFNVVRLEIYI